MTEDNKERTEKVKSVRNGKKHLHFLLFSPVHHCVLHQTHCVPVHINKTSSYSHMLRFLMYAGISNLDVSKLLFVKRCMLCFETPLKTHTFSVNFSPSLPFWHHLFIDDRSCVIFPLVKAFCEKCFKGDEAVLASLSFQYGKLCHGLSGQCVFSCYTLKHIF